MNEAWCILANQVPLTHRDAQCARVLWLLDVLTSTVLSATPPQFSPNPKIARQLLFHLFSLKLSTQRNLHMADMYMSNTRGRGSWSRGGRVGYWRGGQREVGQGTKRQPKPVEEAPALPCGSLLETISLDSIISESHLGYGSPAITDCRAVASYNWKTKREATILVPGKIVPRSIADRLMS